MEGATAAVVLQMHCCIPGAFLFACCAALCLGALALKYAVIYHNREHQQRAKHFETAPDIDRWTQLVGGSVTHCQNEMMVYILLLLQLSQQQNPYSLAEAYTSG